MLSVSCAHFLSFLSSTRLIRTVHASNTLSLIRTSHHLPYTLKLLLFVIFRIFTFVVAESQGGEVKPCISFHRVKLLRMVADLRNPQKFNLAKVKAYTV